MKSLRKILGLARNYKGYLALNVLFNFFAVTFSLFSMAMIMPFLDLIFLKKDSEFESARNAVAPEFSLTVDGLVETFNYQFGKVITSGETLLDGRFNALIFLCIVIIISFFLKNLFTYLALYVMAKVRNGVLYDLRRKTYHKILRLPLSYFSDERKGNILSKFSNDMTEIEWSVLLGIELVFREPITILSILGVMIYMSPQLTLFVFLMLPVTVLVIGRVGNSLRKSSSEAQSMAGMILSSLEETIGGLRIIKAFNGEEKAYNRFQELAQKYFQMMVKVYRKRDLASPLSEFLGVSILAIILWFGGRIVLQEEMQASVFVAFIMFFSQFLSPAKSLSKAWFNVQKGAASADRLDEIIQAEITIRNRENASDLPGFSKRIAFENLEFRYAEDTVLHDINLTIDKGQTVALVGASGGGKSTLADLLPRFHDPVKGRITIDEQPITEVTIESLRSQMGIVTQQSILFNDTVYNNIAFGADHTTMEEVQQAAKIANAHEFIEGLPDGYHTNIGDGGGKLSGGQKQRLSIARAVLKNPAILILDEATSALDTESEQLVQSALNNLMKNRTSLVIAHRLSTIQNADNIVVLEKGMIVEQGTHQQLLEKNGIYKKLYQLQNFR